MVLHWICLDSCGLCIWAHRVHRGLWLHRLQKNIPISRRDRSRLPAWFFEPAIGMAPFGLWKTPGHPVSLGVMRCSEFESSLGPFLSGRTCVAAELPLERPLVSWAHFRIWTLLNLGVKGITTMKGLQGASKFRMYGAGIPHWLHRMFPFSVDAWLKSSLFHPQQVPGGAASMMVKLLWNGSSLTYAEKPVGRGLPASNFPVVLPIRSNLGHIATSSWGASPHRSCRPTECSRAEVRATRTKTFTVLKGVSYLNQRSVWPVTLRRYVAASARFDEWCNGAGRRVGIKRDDIFAAYLDVLLYVGPPAYVYKRGAFVLPWYLDGYMRPSKALAASSDEVFLTRQKDRRITVFFQAAPDEVEVSAADVAGVAVGRCDGTITLCDHASQRAGI